MRISTRRLRLERKALRIEPAQAGFATSDRGFNLVWKGKLLAGEERDDLRDGTGFGGARATPQTDLAGRVVVHAEGVHDKLAHPFQKRRAVRLAHRLQNLGQPGDTLVL